MILDQSAKALYTTLTGGTALTAMLAGTTSVYDTQAPDNATLPYIVFSLFGGGPENLDPNHRENNLWYIRAYSSSGAKNASEIFEQADNLLNRINPAIVGVNTLWSARQQNISTLENTPSGKIWNSGGVYEIRTSEYTGYDWYVDSVNGSDSNDGQTADEAFATITKLLTVFVAGESVGLAKGSHWREQLTIPGNNCTVAAYGTGNRPILDASNIITAASITKTAGYTNVYQITVTPGWSTTNWLNLWEDDNFLTRAASLVVCDSTPGSCYPSADTGTITLYFHAGDSSSPITNGKVYEYSHRIAGLYGYDCTGCTYTGIHTRRNLSKIASLVVGQNSTANDCYASDGNAHNIYCQAGATISGCTAYGAYNGTTAATLIVFYQAAPGGADGYCLNCRCEMPAIDAYVSGFYVHANSPNKWGTVTFDNPTCINLITAFSGYDANGFVINNLVAQNCTYIINNLYALTWTLTGATITGSITNLVRVTTANSTYNISNVDLDAACSSTVLFTDALNLGTFNISGCNFRGSSFTGTCRICVLQGAAITANFSNNVYGNGWTQLYYFQPIGTFTSNTNCFDDNTESFNINGTLYSTVAAYQTGSGQDANSTIGGCAS